VLIVVAMRATRTSAPNILLVTLDTTRADHVGAYGYPLARTPALDGLAREGVLFERALTSAPITLPAHASLLTGTYPFAHGVRNNGTFSLRDDAATLATVLHGNGYRTAAFVSAFVLDRRYGLARGFDVYDDRLPLERPGDQTGSRAVEWLRSAAASSAKAGPFLLWLHLYDPHDPYTPPARFREEFPDRPYDGEIAFDDSVIGSVLSQLGQLGLESNTIVAVVGDHGESLGEHGESTHAVFVYESTLRVPMILRWPGQLPAGRRVRTSVRGIDLAPTLLDLAAAPPLPSAQGVSLAPLMRGADATAVRPIYAESYFPQLYMNWAPLRSMQDSRWKFIDAPAPELYDLTNDSGERTNLIDRMPARAADLRRALDQLTGGSAGTMAERRIDRDAAAKLAALGYVSAATPQTSIETDATRPDPKRMIDVFNAIRAANTALQQGRWDEAADMARAALARDARNAFAMLVLANANRERGRYRDALDGYRAYLEIVPTSADAHHRMAICHARLGNVAGALNETDAALAIDPRFADAHDLRGGLLAGRGRTDDAVRALRTAVDIDPENGAYRVGLARVLTSVGRLDEADAQLRRALQLQPENPDAHAGLGGLLAARGRADAAVEEFERSLRIRQDADDVRLDLATALEAAGRAADARRELERLTSAAATPADIRAAARDRLRRR
jgi:choline-sulfatase